MFNKWLVLLGVVLGLGFAASLQSCKGCNKEKTDAVVADTTTVANNTVPGFGTVTAPRGDTALIPILAKILDDAFAASQKKDYAALASFIVYRGPDSMRYGMDVFTYKTPYEKAIMKTTGDVLNKWNKDVESVDYTRVFEVPGEAGPVPVMEVLFISRKQINRKFFVFVPIGQEYKIAEITSML